MRSVLAERLLKSLMEWDVPRFGYEVARVQMLATLKYDEYGGYRAGIKFAENFARWLEQFDLPEREIAFNFVMERLIFISDGEMAHLIEVAYPDLLEQRLLKWTATEIDLPTYCISRVASSPEFLALRRRSLFLGLSDGARLDRLRRASGLSHEQFIQNYLIDSEQALDAQKELQKALDVQKLPGDATFRQLVLVDDFSGSGRTLLREHETQTGSYKGKLIKFRERLKVLSDSGIVSDDARVAILLYVASEQAMHHLDTLKPAVGLDAWTIDVVQVIGRRSRVDVTNPAMADLCHAYYDPNTADIHKADTPIGYEDCALPLVLGHNTPNNSVCLLWAESDDGPESNERRALFPRYERHHRDRP